MSGLSIRPEPSPQRRLGPLAALVTHTHREIPAFAGMTTRMVQKHETLGIFRRIGLVQIRREPQF
ncbi:hypothetical protein ASE78_15720 [Sphingomonas sp. Leaf25]|nr:hypothetical protein ASE78_15720 [Sphingomonas sp. Leaf25]